jgi:hypothetical protein
LRDKQSLVNCFILNERKETERKKERKKEKRFERFFQKTQKKKKIGRFLSQSPIGGIQHLTLGLSVKGLTFELKMKKRIL